MDIILKIGFDDDAILATKATEKMKESGIDIQPSVRNVPPTEVVAILGSVGAFTGLYQIIVELLRKNKDRVITIKRKDFEASFTNVSLPEMEKWIEQFAPELKSGKKKRKHS
jgi:hypothetical protein